MYVPDAFAPTERDVTTLLGEHGAADLVTSTPTGLCATFLPFVFDPAEGEHGALLGHIARANDQWSRPVLGEAMIIVRGPHAYVSPTWYAATAEHGRVVPTWNHVTAQVHGRLIVHDDASWVEAVVRRLTLKHEGDGPDAWSVDQAPPRYITGRLRAIVGLEMRITRIEASFKLSQNRSAPDVDGVVAGLTRLGDAASATAVRTANGGAPSRSR